MEKQKTKKILMAIQTNRLFEQKMNLITLTNYPMFFWEKSKDEDTKIMICKEYKSNIFDLIRYLISSL